MRVRPEHWAYIIKYAEQNPEIITNKCSDYYHKRKKLWLIWKKLVDGLNSLGYGEKSIGGWRKTLTDWKSKTKTKASQIEAEKNKTGEAPSGKILNSCELRLLELMNSETTEDVKDPLEIKSEKVQTAKASEKMFAEIKDELGMREEIIIEMQDESDDGVSRSHFISASDNYCPTTTLPVNIDHPTKFRNRNIRSRNIIRRKESTVNVLKSIEQNLVNVNGNLSLLNDTFLEIKHMLRVHLKK